MNESMMVKKFRRYLYSFWRNSGTWQTDRRTPGDSIYRAYAYASRGKNCRRSSDLKKTLTTHIHTYRHSSHRYYKLCWLQAAVRQKKQNRLQCNLLRTRTTTTTTANNKLSCRSETARRFLSLNILLSHSRSFKTTLLSRACVSTY